MTLQEMEKQIKSDPRNAEYTARGIPPIFQINPGAEILIVGQAPGKKVEESGILFQDKSGEKLREWMGIDKELFYSKRIAIMPMDFYYPGKGKTGDLPPRRFIAEEYHPEILAMMPEVRLTILIGKYSVDYYLKKRAKKNLTETVRCYQEYLPEYFSIVHPSPLNFRWQAKNPWFESEVVPELRKRVADILENSRNPRS
ncbi:MAG TPA: uracil-DNA glycosylase [Lachnospiraceae bacterium]|jgi:uracil-DNA glycosylase|nr:uracil-DNA glycosylase [Lachnospiraceae bacterium]